MTGIFIKRGEFRHGFTQKENDQMKTKAETEVMLPQTKECQRLLAALRSEMRQRILLQRL